MHQNIFDDVGHSSTGLGTISTMVNANIINMMKNVKIPGRIGMKGGEHSININDSTSTIICYTNCHETSALSENGWTLVMVYNHNLKFDIQQILNGFNEVVGNCFFLPFAYTRVSNVDYFLVKNQNDALRELMKKQLQIQVDGWKLPILLKVEVANWQDGQIQPRKNIIAYLQRKIKELTPFGVLDLSNISKEQEFIDLCFSLKNRGVNKIFFDQMNSCQSIKSNSKFRSLKLCNNSIQSLENFSKLHDFHNIEVLDLSSNEILDINELYNLKNLNLKELNIIGNACSKYPNIEDRIQMMLPRVRMLNNKLLSNAQFDSISVPQTGNKEISKLGDGTLIKLNNFNSYRNRFVKLVNEHCWHQVILHHNKRFTTEDILKELGSNLLKDVHFYPCYTQRLDTRDEFFLYRNFEALQKLFLTGLKIQMSHNSFTIDVQIRLNVAEYKAGEVNWSEKIKYALRNRINDDVLDLNDFPKDPEFSKVNIIMNSNTTIDFIVQQSKLLNINIKQINAEHCEIFNCRGIDESLFMLPNLSILNLNHNCIANLDGFNKTGMIKEIYLDGNPVCFRPTWEYIKHVRDYFKNIKYIDGHKLCEKTFTVIYQNYLIDNSLYMVASEFVDHFFHMWDSFERQSKLISFYTSTSIFTLSIHYEYDDQVQTMRFERIYPRIQSLLKFNRNLKKMSNMNQVLSHVYCGRDDIGRVFGELSKSEHEFSTMTVDVPYYDRKGEKLLIVVTGMFNEYLNNSEESALPYSFSRTFLLKVTDGRYTIINDKLNLAAPTRAQVDILRKENKIVTKKEVLEQCRSLLPTEQQEQVLKLEVFQELTSCSQDYCRKLLQDSSWDLKLSLACFTTRLEKNEIPDDQFKF